MWLLIILFAFLLGVVIYIKVRKRYQYWKEKGIFQVQPTFLIGSLGPVIFRTRSMAHLTEDIYKSHPSERYVGLYEFLKPALLVRDPDLIKQIMVKDFDAFPEHRSFVSEDIDPLFEKNLLSMKGGEKWQTLRATLSPSFTSSKMRMMFSLMKDCAKQFTDYFQNQGNMITVEMKDTFSRFTNDVIGSTAFGVTCDSLKDKENEVYVMAKEATNFSGVKGLVFMLYALSPSLMKLLNIGILGKKGSAFFKGLIWETIRVREEKGIIRPDMIHLLLEARKGLSKSEDQSNVADLGYAVVQESKPIGLQKHQKIEITDMDITAQAIAFFFAGFETSSTLMCYMAYELALNPEVQEKLTKEIVDTLKKCNGDIVYETLLNMKYLDMVVSETLRKWPPNLATDRQCVKNYTFPAELPGEKPLHLDADTNCWIPIYAIHRDPKYYPNPEKFDPERFSSENKDNIKPYTFLPFGAGPRHCIGLRFALLETKLIIFEVLSKFEIVPVEKTQIPIALSKGGVTMSPEKGFWLGLKAKCITK